MNFKGGKESKDNRVRYVRETIFCVRTISEQLNRLNILRITSNIPIVTLDAYRSNFQSCFNSL